MNEYTGWLFDLYAHPQKGVVLWLIGRDRKRYSFFQDFEFTFYASGPFPRLRELWLFLHSKPVKLERTERDDLFTGSQEVMQIRVQSPTAFRRLFQEVSERFSDLTFYDTDIPLTLRYAAAFNVFTMAYCKVTAQADGRLIDVTALDAPWELVPKLPRLRKLSINPDIDPSHAPPTHLSIKFNGFSVCAPVSQSRMLLGLLNDILSEYDPDVIETKFGDQWLFPYLLGLSRRTGIPFNPNRDPSIPLLRRKEVTFFNYGRAHYRGPQVHLRGRWHIDTRNCMTYNDYGLIGAIEQARLSSLPVQEAARRSPGAGIASMQTVKALGRGALIPYQHQKSEIPKTYNQLVKSDRGGLVFQPLLGLFQNVAILDFSSMMASIMVEFNVSPETAGVEEEGALELPELGIKIGHHLGLMPETLRPLRDKRLTLKRLLKALDRNDPHYNATHRRYKSAADALKWLSVVAYGRLGYANSTFGRINAHEVVSYLARKVILQAKAVAEDSGFTVLHLYVDSLFVSCPDASGKDFRALADEIEQETHLPIDVEDVYSWFAFTSSRQNSNLSVANRFYGLSEGGKYKVRGLALRRRDTPAFVAAIQMQVLNILAVEKDPTKLAGLLPEVLELVRERLSLLKERKIPVEELVVTRTLSRELNEYRVLTPLAVATRQLQIQGKTLRMGQQVRFIHIAPAPGVFAWDLPSKLDPRAIDVPFYRSFVLRAVHEVLQPLGVSEKILADWLLGRPGYYTWKDLLSAPGPSRLALPLFRDVERTA